MKIFYGGALLLPETAAAHLWLVLALPLGGALLCGLFGAALDRRLGRRASPAIAVAAMLAATATAVATVVLRLLPLPREARSLHQALWPMFDVAGVEVTFGLTVDALSAVMTLVVTAVGTLIHVYAAAYMKDDPGRARFFCYLNLFVAAMLLLVLGDGFVPLLFGWEGVGLCSYLLIGFWYQRPAAADAAMKAFVVNRFGDCGFLLGIALLLWGLGARFDAGGGVIAEPGREVATVASRVPGAPLDPKYWARQARTADVRVGPTLGFRALRDQLTVEVGAPGARGNERAARVRPFAEALRQKRLGGVPVVFLVCMLLFLGAAGKSAQVPLFAWLPDAMAGPTPVSALIHAATMVTAGVYLFARLSFLLMLSPGAMAAIAGVGVATAVVGATAAALQMDLKRLLAYSTVSQLGFMFAALGVGAFDAAIFHVVTHAVFKACLFLSAGTIIGALHARDAAVPVGGDVGAGAGVDVDAQDLRAMGGLSRALPWTRWAFLIAAIGLGGLPLGAGFFSKDRILAAVLGAAGAGSVAAGVAFVALAVVVALTAFYVFRGYYLVFRSGSPRTAGTGAAHEPALASPLIFVLVLLAVATIVVGPWLGWPRAWSAAHEPSSFERFLAPVFAASRYQGAPAELGLGAERALEIGGVALAIGGLLLARRLYRASSARLSREGARGRAAMFVASGWRFDELYRGLVLAPARDVARAAVWLDRRIFDALVNGLGALGMLLGRLAGAMDRGVVDGAVNGVSTLVLAAGRRTARLQTGRIGTYVAGIAGGIAVLVVLAYVLGS